MGLIEISFGGDGPTKMKIDLIKWDMICMRKENGGLGVKRAKDQNLALLTKFGWKFLVDKEDLLTNIFRARYLGRNSVLNWEDGKSSSRIWKDDVGAPQPSHDVPPRSSDKVGAPQPSLVELQEGISELTSNRPLASDSGDSRIHLGPPPSQQKQEDALTGSDFWCNYCKKKLPPKPKCKFDVELGDPTGLIIATAFGEISESLFGITAEELYDNTNEEELSLEYVEKLMTPCDYAVHVQATMYDNLGNSHCKFTIKAMHDLASIKPATEAQIEQPAKKMKRGQTSTETAAPEDATITEVPTIILEDAGPKILHSMKKKTE
ncbi:hypothetical protein Vadar_023804 [Vaccinium darrowii]|uniref:Uncharacterized protein n=1 Tax=Vaccinium darrowii TaxID=229202 RepID=A0ACB7XJI3_9ERIC|nr:hypothetical protein Vadar_023804 [Vaccinium darrowii]